eukprot:6183482-Pleurochrysis_carterae.AAC.1
MSISAVAAGRASHVWRCTKLSTFCQRSPYLACNQPPLPDALPTRCLPFRRDQPPRLRPLPIP